MTLRRIQFLTFGVILFTLLLASGVAQPTGRSADATTSIPTTWAFEGCWEPFQFSTCRDVFRDEQGNYWICKTCGTTGNPGPSKCSQPSLAALDTGFWCSWNSCAAALRGRPALDLDCKRLMERDLNVAKFELLEGELKAKGSELAYIMKQEMCLTVQVTK